MLALTLARNADMNTYAHTHTHKHTHAHTENDAGESDEEARGDLSDEQTVFGRAVRKEREEARRKVRKKGACAYRCCTLT